MPFSGYSSQGFEDETAKHTTTFEATIPEARDPSAFPAGANHSDEQHQKRPNHPEEKEHTAEHDDRYNSAGFLNISGGDDSGPLRTAEPGYTMEGFPNDKREEREGGCSKL
jgi:hypothetical protein